MPGLSRPFSTYLNGSATKASCNHLSRKTYPHSFTTLYILCLFWSLHLSWYLFDHGARSKIFIIFHSNGDVLYYCTSYLLHKLHCLFLNTHRGLWGLCSLVILICHHKHILQEFVVIMARTGVSEDPNYVQSWWHETTLSFCSLSSVSILFYFPFLSSSHLFYLSSISSLMTQIFALKNSKQEPPHCSTDLELSPVHLLDNLEDTTLSFW